MNNILAQYLFNKEIIYRNPVSQLIPEKEIITAVTEAVPAVAETPAPPSVPTVHVEAGLPISALKLNHPVLIVTGAVTNEEKQFLNKVLGAVGLSLAQVDLIEIPQAYPIDFSSFVAQETTTRFISFGVGVSKLNWDLVLTPYQIKNVSGIDFLLANDLSAISADTSHKKSLWAALQLMFGR